MKLQLTLVFVFLSIISGFAQDFVFTNTSPAVLEAALKSSASIAIGSKGETYIAEDRLIHVYDSTGKSIRTISSVKTKTGLIDLKEPTCVYVDQKDVLYIYDDDLEKMFVFPQNGVGFSFGTHGGDLGQIDDITGIAADATGYIYLLNSRRKQVDIFTPDGTHVSWIAGTTEPFDNPIAIGVNARNELYVLEAKGPTVFMFDIHGMLINTNRTLIRKAGAEVSSPIAMAVAENGEFFILDEKKQRVTHFDRLGDVIDFVGSRGTSAKGVFADARFLAIHTSEGQNRLAILDQSNHQAQVFKVTSKIGSFTSDEKRVQLFEAGSQRSPLADIAVAPSGFRYTINAANHHTVFAYRDSSEMSMFQLKDRFEDAVGLATDAASNIYVLDRGAKEIFMFDKSGVLIRKFGKNIPKKLKDPVCIAIQSNGNIIVGDHDNGYLHAWNSQGVYQKAIVTPDNTPIRAPRRIAIDSKDEIFVWDDSENTIFKIGSQGFPVAEKQLKARGEKPGWKSGLIKGFYIDPLDQLHLYNATNGQLEVYAWDLEPRIVFSCGHPGTDKNGFADIDDMIFDRQSFNIFFPKLLGTKQQVYQFVIKPPVPDDQFSFDLANNKLQVTFSPVISRAVVGYGLITATRFGADSIYTRSATPTMLITPSTKGGIRLKHYNAVTFSQTDSSDPNKGFDDYYTYANQLMSTGKYDEALVAYQQAIDKMHPTDNLTNAISHEMSTVSKNLAKNSEVVKSLQYARAAFELTPDDKITKDAYCISFVSFFEQLANREDYIGIINEAERIIYAKTVKPIALRALDSLSISMSLLPNESAISHALLIQKKLTEWDPENVGYFSSLASTSYAYYKLKHNLGVPKNELELLLEDAEKYATTASSGLRARKKPYHESELLLIEVLNEQEQFDDAETHALKELSADYELTNDLQIRYRTQLARAYEGQQKIELASLEYTRILAMDPLQKSTKLSLAKNLVLSDKYDEAKALYQQLLLDDRDNAQIIGHIGEIELQRQNYAEASFQLEKACKLAPSDRSFYGPLAESFEGASNNQKAVENYAIAINYLDEKIALARNSFSSAEEIASLQKQQHNYLMRSAELNAATGEFDASIQNYNQLIALNPADAEAHFGLGKVNLSAGLVYDAETHLNEALKLDPTKEIYSKSYSEAIKVRDENTKSTASLSILDIQVKELFPSLYRNYGDVKLLPVGEVVIANNGKSPITPSSISVFVKDIMSQPTIIKSPALLPYSNTRVKLAGLFTDKILNYTTDERMQVEVEITYNHGNTSKTVKNSATFVLHGRNAISWKDKRRLSAFISPNEELLINYIKKADAAFKAQPSNSLNKTLLKALQVFTMLHNDHIGYSPDPQQSYAYVSTNTDILDFLQYPIETMQRKSGDCDDLVTLYVSLLENSGIATAYIDVPGHVFMAFDTQIKADELAGSGLNQLDVIIANGKVWIPIETTMIGRSQFIDAWKSGSQRYYDELTKGNFPELVTMADARKVYIPSSYFPAGIEIEPNTGDEVMIDYAQQVNAILAKTKKAVLSEMENRYQLEPQNVYVKNKYASLLAQIGEWGKAERVLNEALELAPTSATVLNNLGNLSMLQSKGAKAAEYYKLAAEADPSDAAVYINLCKACLASGQKDTAKTAFDKAIQLDFELEAIYGELKQQLK